jgi:hypothetical protein
MEAGRLEDARTRIGPCSSELEFVPSANSARAGTRGGGIESDLASRPVIPRVGEDRLCNDCIYACQAISRESSEDIRGHGGHVECRVRYTESLIRNLVGTHFRLIGDTGVKQVNSEREQLFGFVRPFFWV